MGSATAVTPPPLGLGRATLLIAASLLLHAFALTVMRDRLVAPAADSEPPTRTIEAALLVEAPPAPPPPPRRAPPRRPRPAPPPVVASEPAPVVVPADTPMPAAPEIGRASCRERV